MSADTYRPPTRVTLTDAEREMGRPMFVGETRVGVAFTEGDVENVLAARIDELQARLNAIAEFAGHPGNWSAADGRRRLIRDLATGSIDPASRDWSDINLPPKGPT